MPSPREIALAVNDRSKFGEEPADTVPTPREPDYRVNPQNPPDGPPPVKVTKS